MSASHACRLATARVLHHCGRRTTPAALTLSSRPFGLFSRKSADPDDGDMPMTRLGGRQPADDAASPLASGRTNAPDRSDDTKLIATLQEQNRALTERVAHLMSELDHTQQMVRQLAALVDRAHHKNELAKLASTLAGGGGMFLVQNSSELAHALTLPGARIVLTKGRLYVLDMFQPVTIAHTSVTIIGNGAVILGTFALSDGATLDVSDATLFAPNGAKPISRERFNALTPEEKASYAFTAKEEVTPSVPRACRHFHPVVGVTANSQVHLTRCTLSNGRDGVYLGLNSCAYLNTVKIVNCIRGVYEGVRCRAMLTGTCELIGNYYHLVLLGNEKADRARAVIVSTSGQGDAANAHDTERLRCIFKDTAEPRDLCPMHMYGEEPVVLRTSRADVVLEQDPIGDTYDACWKNGQPYTLPEALRTANLSDPVY